MTYQLRTCFKPCFRQFQDLGAPVPKFERCCAGRFQDVCAVCPSQQNNGRLIGGFTSQAGFRGVIVPLK